MVVIKNSAPENLRSAARLAVVCFTLLVLLAGCGAPGPRALLKGEDLIKERNFKAAVAELEKATRLLPRNPQAWNHLGLAHHGAGQVEQAQRAYKEALRLDINLGPARYNLGTLSLEQNDLPGAIEHLTSYTTFQPNAADGWTKLGNAQVRARRLDQAEKSYKNALDLRPRDPEALNGLGAVAYHRRRTQEAVSFFNSALGENPKYAPALLNTAVIHHSQNNRQQALDELKQYASLAPFAPNIDAVHVTIEQLESELNPAAPTVSGIALPRTNTAVQTQPQRPAQTTAPPPIVSAPRTNPPSIAAAPRTRPTPTNPPATVSRPVAATNRAEKPPDVPVTRLEDDLLVTPAQDLTSSRPTNPGTAQPATASNTPSAATTNDNREEKRGLLARLNPFGGRSKSLPTTNTAVEPEIRSASPTNLAAAPSPAPPVTPPPTYPRYRYASPQLPKAGNRREAERHFARGVASQKAMQYNQALGYYQQAVEADPAYFDAYYNLGLAAYDSGRWKQSLAAYEVALALKSESIDTRYNFALALKQGGYPLDAVEELKQILKGAPSETRAHLSLANLYAQQLNQPRLARQHYLKVLELEPAHPKGSEIRYWLAANP